MKFNRAKVTGFLILLVGCMSAAQVNAEKLKVNTQTRSGPLELTVVYKAGMRDWAQSILNESPKYIRMVERYLKSRYRWGRSLTIEGCDDCTSRAELSKHKIYLDYRYSTPDDVSVLFHEINHFWFYYYVNRSNEEWLIEGISSFLPNALREKHILPDRALYHETIDSYWGLEWNLPDTLKDVPLYPFNEGKRKLVYTKSYRLQYLINCLLGPGKYQAFVREISHLRRRNPDAVIKILARHKRANWRDLLGGWVLGRSYRSASIADFTTDGDSDGLSRAAEFCHGTNPDDGDTDGDSLPDGAEILLGRNPRRIDADGIELEKQYGPFTDGSGEEWPLFESASWNDSVNDMRGPYSTDMTQMSALIRGGMLHILIKTSEQAVASPYVFFDLLVDTNNDNYTDEEFAFFLGAPGNPWHYSVSTGEGKSLFGLKAAMGEHIEMAIPLNAISSQSFRLLPIIRDNEAKMNFDEWDEWCDIAE